MKELVILISKWSVYNLPVRTFIGGRLTSDDAYIKMWKPNKDPPPGFEKLAWYELAKKWTQVSQIFFF